MQVRMIEIITEHMRSVIIARIHNAQGHCTVDCYHGTIGNILESHLGIPLQLKG